MQRTKQQALMFLLGAVLFGGVLGFSADRVLRKEQPHNPRSSRQIMYDDLGLSAAQRASMDSILDERNCQRQALFRTIAPQVDSIHAASRLRMIAVMTPEQRERFERRRAEMDEKYKQERARRDASRRPTEVCK